MRELRFRQAKTDLNARGDDVLRWSNSVEQAEKKKLHMYGGVKVTRITRNAPPWLVRAEVTEFANGKHRFTSESSSGTQ